MKYELKGKIKDVSVDTTGNATLTLSVENKKALETCYDELKNVDKLSITLKKHYEKRSLNANAYFWYLCGQIADVTEQDVNSIYREFILNLGDNYIILPIKDNAVDTFIKNWSETANGVKRLGWICSILGNSKIQGYTNVCAYYGSSTYDKKQMNKLINDVIFECNNLGIPTATDEEINKMLDSINY